jgi:hypothetical protein
MSCRWLTRAVHASADRKTWAPHSAAKAVELDTIRGTWRLNPQVQSVTHGGICMVVRVRGPGANAV